MTLLVSLLDVQLFQSFWLLSVLVLLPFGSILLMIINSWRAGLAHVPGPFLARYTDLWHLYKAWTIVRRGGKVELYQRLQAQYGQYIRIGPRSMLALNHEAVPVIYGVRARLDKGPAYKPFRQPGVKASLVSIRDESTHGQYRKMISNAFSLSSLKAYEPCIDDMVNRFIEVCDEHAQASKSMDLARWCHYYCYDVVSMLTLGQPLGFMSGSGQDAYSLIEHVKAFGRYVMVASQMPWLHKVFRDNPIMRRIHPAPFMRIVQARVSDRLEEEKPNPGALRPDLLSHFIAAHRTNPLMTRQNVAVTSATNLVAGGLSPGSTVECLCEYLAHHPEAQDKLYEELSQALFTTPAPFDAVKDLPYLDGVVREALRLHESASLGLQRIAGPGGLDLPGGCHLPANTKVNCSADAINKDPRLWGEDADTYNPERWTKQQGEEDDCYEERRRQYMRCDLTFGHGSRACIGKSVAMLEIFKVIASLVKNFQFELVGEAKKGCVNVRVYRRTGSSRTV